MCIIFYNQKKMTYCYENILIIKKKMTCCYGNILKSKKMTCCYENMFNNQKNHGFINPYTFDSKIYHLFEQFKKMKNWLFY